LGLVAIGTIADVSPLTNVNRILVRVGLDYLAKPDRPGLVSLKKVAALDPDRPPSARDVAFRLAPRLNAAGRLGSPEPGLELLLTRDTGRARIQADDLDRLNNQRRRLQMDIFKEALAMLENRETDLGMAIVLAKEGWPRGVVGLAASKLAEKFRRPAILLAIEDGLAVGSGRSVEGFNIFAALNECRDLMVRFGGHEQAAGLAVEKDRLDGLARAFENIAAREIGADDFARVLNIDAVTDLTGLTQGLVDELDGLAPFGQDNPEPTLALTGLTVHSAGVVGSGHLKLTLGQRGQTLNTIGFNLGHLLSGLGPRVSAAVRQYDSVYRGRASRGWKIVDIKKE
jgi:single-stranded-DNA-specific exonuclease